MSLAWTGETQAGPARPIISEWARVKPDRIPLCVPDLRDGEIEAVSKAVRDSWVSSAGPEVVALEQAIARHAGRSFAVATVNGTAALHLALFAVGVRPGDEVIVPDWTFAASANAVVHAGARPRFVDVAWPDWALDAGLVDEVLSANPNIKAVIAVDPVGHSADFIPLTEICAKHGVPLIEDAAGAIGATYDGKPCGSFGRVSTFSFNGNKTITAGGGGMLLTDDGELAGRIRHVSSTARIGGDYLHDQVGWNYRMPNLNASLALAQSARLDEILEAKRNIAARYDQALSSRADLVPMPRPRRGKSSCWLYNVRTASEHDAAALVSALDKAGIDARVFWRALSPQPAWTGSVTCLRGVSASLSGTVVSLPSSAHLAPGQQQRVIDALETWRGGEVVRSK